MLHTIGLIISGIFLLYLSLGILSILWHYKNATLWTLSFLGLLAYYILR